MERLQKIIAGYGYTSRRKAEELIKKGEVKVNGKVVTELGTKVGATDEIEIDGIVINKDVRHEYYILNKPRSVISAVSDDHDRITVTDLIDTDARIYPVGRLDYDTTGLIILTNDGEFANMLMHPSFEIEKTYLVKTNRFLEKEDFDKLKKGIVIDGRKVDIRKINVKKKDREKNTMLVEVTIIEGRNHIIKKIFESLHIDVVRLTRVSFGFLNVDDLKSGEYRTLTIKEIKKLYALANKNTVNKN